MKNVHSSDGMAEDLIRAFVQFGCAELHAKTLVEKAVAELENGLVENIEDQNVLNTHLEKIERYRDMVNTYAELRRSTMLYIYNLYDGNKDVWCEIKHLGNAMFTIFEAYQASDNDPALERLWLDANAAFIKVLSEFLGKEITACASCFADMMRKDVDLDGNEI